MPTAIFVQPTTNTIPAGAVFASPNGLPTNAGTEASPKDLLSAYAATPVNGTLVMGGTLGSPYRGIELVISKKINIVPRPTSSPVLLGSTPIPTNEFVLDSGDIYYKPGFTTTIPPFTKPDYITPEHPFSGNLQQVFVNDVYYTQVGSKAALVTNTFFYDSAASRLYIKGNPAGKTVEVSHKNRGINITANADGTKITGITVARYAEYGINVQGQSCVLTKVNAFYNSFRGILLQGAKDSILNDCGVYYSGGTGVKISTPNNFQMLGGIVEGSNIANFARYYDAAAIKIIGQHDGPMPLLPLGVNVIKGVKVLDSNCHGIWVDINLSNVEVSENIISKTTGGFGIHVEISQANYIVNNLIMGCRYGIVIQNTRDTLVANNTIVGGAIEVRSGTRVNGNVAQRDAGLDWRTTGNRIINNAYDFKTGSSVALLNMQLNNTTLGNTSITVMSNNAYNRASATLPPNLIRWKNTANTYASYDTIPEFRTAFPTYEAGSITRISNGASNAFFNESDYSTKSTSPTVGAGTVVTGVHARLVGLASGATANIGSYTTLSGTVLPEPPPADACAERIEDATLPLISQIGTLNDELNACEETLANTLEQLSTAEAALVTATSTLTGVQADLSSKNASLAAAQTSLATANTNLATAQANLATANSSLASSAADLSAASQNISILESSLLAANATNTTLQASLTTSSSIITGLQSDVNSLQGSLAVANATNTALQASLTTSNNVVAGLQSDVNSLQTSLLTANETNTTLQTSLISTNNIVTGLQTQLAIANASVVSKDNQLATVNTQLTAANNQISLLEQGLVDGTTGLAQAKLNWAAILDFLS